MLLFLELFRSSIDRTISTCHFDWLMQFQERIKMKHIQKYSDATVLSKNFFSKAQYQLQEEKFVKAIINYLVNCHQHILAPCKQGFLWEALKKYAPSDANCLQDGLCNYFQTWFLCQMLKMIVPMNVEDISLRDVGIIIQGQRDFIKCALVVLINLDYGQKIRITYLSYQHFILPFLAYYLPLFFAGPLFQLNAKYSFRFCDYFPKSF